MQKIGSTGDQTSEYVLWQVAQDVIRMCVIPTGRGGVRKFDFSRNNEISLVVRDYHPVLDCDSGKAHIPSYEACKDVLERMPTDPKMMGFTTGKQ
ncbi:MAG: hypothetical protein Q9218_005418, partial [Villophora microphyllina]